MRRAVRDGARRLVELILGTVEFVPRTRLTEAERDRDKLRARTHEIQAEESRKRSECESALAKLRNAYREAKKWTEDEGLVADWAIPPSSPFWSMCSVTNKEALARLVSDRNDERAHADELAEAAGELAEADRDSRAELRALKRLDAALAHHHERREAE